MGGRDDDMKSMSFVRKWGKGRREVVGLERISL